MYFMLSFASLGFLILFLNSLKTDVSIVAKIYMLSLSVFTLALAVYHFHKLKNEIQKENQLKNP